VKIANLSRDWGDLLGGDVAVIIEALLGAGTWKQSVRVATTGNVTITTALNAGDTIDGVTLAGGDRVLVWQQTAAAENGIYEAGATPERTADFDESDEITGTFVPVSEGTVYAGALFRNTNTGLVDVDTDDITFELWPTSSGSAAANSMVPYFIASGETFTVPEFKQALFSEAIDNEGTLDVEGLLIEVD
jgi:hypothetical protein